MKIYIIIIIVCSIIAFYFFIMAFISSRKNKNNEYFDLEEDNDEDNYYDEPQIEGVKEITYGLSNIKSDLSSNDNTTTSIPKIIQSNPIDITNINNEVPTLVSSIPLENINQNPLVKEDKKTILDDEII